MRSKVPSIELCKEDGGSKPLFHGERRSVLFSCSYRRFTVVAESGLPLASDVMPANSLDDFSAQIKDVDPGKQNSAYSRAIVLIDKYYLDGEK